MELSIKSIPFFSLFCRLREEPENKQITMSTDKNPADPNSEDPTSRNIFQKIIGIFQLITIEPTVFFYAVGYSITMVVSPGLYLEKICTVLLKHFFFNFSCRFLNPIFFQFEL